MNTSSTRRKMMLPDAVEKIFDLQLSKHPHIKHALNSLVRSDVIAHEKTTLGGGYGHRNRIWIYRDQFDLIHNAIILQGLFSETKTITRILKDSGKFVFRNRMAELAHVILVGRQSIVGISLITDEVQNFLDMLSSDVDLSTKRLPNPFKTLPQLILSEGTSTIQALLAQGALLSNGDTMMVHYLNGDMEKAYEAARQLQTDNPTLGKYKALIEKEFANANEFDELLDILK